MDHKIQKIKLNSDAFPVSKIDGKKVKISPISETHRIIKELSLQIDKTKIIYKKLGRIHLKEIIDLHQEWLPVKYEDSFFENALSNINNSFITIGAMYPTEQREIIIGAIFIEVQEFNQKFKKHSSEGIISKMMNEISFNEKMRAIIQWTDYHCAYIMTLGIIDECRRLKIGSELISKAIDIVLDDPLCICLYLDVIDYNKSAIQFYLKNNFEEVTTIKNYYHINEEVYDSYVYVRVLTIEEKKIHKRKSTRFFYLSINEWICWICYFIFAVITFNVFCKCFRKKQKSD